MAVRNSRKAIGKGLLFAHGMALLEEQATVDQYAPDIRDDKDLRRTTPSPIIVVATFLLPGIIGGLSCGVARVLGMFWGGVVRIHSCP